MSSARSAQPRSPESIKLAFDRLEFASHAVEIRERQFVETPDLFAKLAYHRAMGEEIDALLRAERARLTSRPAARRD